MAKGQQKSCLQVVSMQESESQFSWWAETPRETKLKQTYNLNKMETEWEEYEI